MTESSSEFLDVVSMTRFLIVGHFFGAANSGSNSPANDL